MDKLLQHYEQELDRLTQEASEYAIAHAPELGHDENEDPEIERLLQAVVLLNASMQKCIEAIQRDFHHALLKTIQRRD